MPGSMSARRFPFAARDAELGGGVAGEDGELGRVEEQRRVAAGEHDLQLLDIGLAAAEAGRQRQRNRPSAGIDRAEESGGEFGAGLGDQRETVAGLEAEGDEAARIGQRVVAQLGIGIGADQRAARIVEIEAAACLARHNRALRQAWRNRRCGAAGVSVVGVAPGGARPGSIAGVAVEHAVPS